MDTTKPARWFRMYAEFATDPKVQMLSEVDQRRYVLLLCLRCSNGNVTLQEHEVAFQLRISDEEWGKTKAILVGKNLIKNDNTPTAWNVRQYASDSSTERVSKHRERKRNDMKRYSNDCVTSPEKETEKEKEEKKPKTLSVCTDDVVKVIEHLNNVTGSRFRPVDANARLIKARIKESSAADCISVIDKKAEEWQGDMRQYLRPSTLFSAKNFASYLGATTESFNVQEYCNEA